MNATLDSLRDLIRSNDLESAAERIREIAATAGKQLGIDAGVWALRINQLRKHVRSGTISQGDAAVERARIAESGLELVDVIECKLPHAPPGYIGNIMIAEPVPEKIFGVAKMRHLAWLRRGLEVARSVCRLIAPSWYGTGFLVRDSLLVTNHHVLSSRDVVNQTEAEFDYEEDLTGRIGATIRYRLDPDSWVSNPEIDCAGVRLVPSEGKPSPSSWGALELELDTSPAIGDHVAIIQHPEGGPKRIAMSANQVVNIYQHRLRYVTDTLPGSSGSPVFNDRWRVMAVHSAGGNLIRNEHGDRIYANEGILATALAAALFGE